MIHYRARLAFAAWLLAGTAASAQVGPIAFAKTAGRNAEVHLINADGTGDTLLYKGGPRSEIFHVDIRPGGGQLAIEEHVRTSPNRPESSSAIKIIDYDDNGSIVGSVRTLQLTCRSGSLDYHPTDGTLLYRDCGPPRVRRLNPSTMTSVDLGLSINAFVASWLDATHLLYHGSGSEAFYTVSTDSLGSPTAVSPLILPHSLDTSTSGNKALLSGFSGVRLLNIPTTTQPPLLEGSADKGHFSPDDIYVAHIRLGNGGDFLMIRRLDGAGSPTNLAGRGNYTALDWRN